MEGVMRTRSRSTNCATGYAGNEPGTRDHGNSIHEEPEQGLAGNPAHRKVRDEWGISLFSDIEQNLVRQTTVESKP